MLGYQYTPGRHASYNPDSPDLDRLVQLMETLSYIAVRGNSGLFKKGRGPLGALSRRRSDGRRFLRAGADALGLDSGQRADLR